MIPIEFLYKNVTIKKKRDCGICDAVTSRGLKHVKELLKANQKGYKIFLFLVQRDDCNKFELAKDIDPEYELLTKVVKKNLNIPAMIVNFHQKE